MAPSASTGTDQQQTVGDTEEQQEVIMNISLSGAVSELHTELASQMDLCNNLLGQFSSVRRISSTPYGGGAPLVDRLSMRRLHPNWTGRLKVRLHLSLSECVENLRQFSVHRLPALARQFERVAQQSSPKDDDVALLVADFEFSLAVDAARPNSAIFDRYTFETDDRALVAAHLRRLAARLDSELDRLTNLVAFESDGAAGDGSVGPNGAKLRRQAFALRGSTKTMAASNNNINRMAISLEPYLMLNMNVGVHDEHSDDGVGGGRRGIGAMPDWSVELALGRLSTGGGRFF